MVNPAIRMENRVKTVIVADLDPEAGTATRTGNENVTATIGGAAEAVRGTGEGVADLGVVTADVRGNVSATIGAVAVLPTERTGKGRRPASKMLMITKVSSSHKT